KANPGSQDRIQTVLGRGVGGGRGKIYHVNELHGGMQQKMKKMKSNRPELVVIGHSNVVTSVAFFPDGKSLVSDSRDHTAIIWNVQTGTMLRLLSLQEFLDVREGISLTTESILVSNEGKA